MAADWRRPGIVGAARAHAELGGGGGGGPRRRDRRKLAGTGSKGFVVGVRASRHGRSRQNRRRGGAGGGAAERLD
jgi:hypothetical protein